MNDIDLERSRSCALTLFKRPSADEPPPYRRVILPGNATVKIGDKELFIAQGMEKMVGPVESFEYELINWAPTRPHLIRRLWR
jgi:hypothetical protein